MRDELKILTDLLQNIVYGLVDNEGDARVTAVSSSEGTILFEINANKDDVGKLIGRSGKTAGAIRHIMGAASSKLDVRSIVAIPDKKFAR